jgi:hypothetical protein
MINNYMMKHTHTSAKLINEDEAAVGCITEDKRNLAHFHEKRRLLKNKKVINIRQTNKQHTALLNTTHYDIAGLKP